MDESYGKTGSSSAKSKNFHEGQLKGAGDSRSIRHTRSNSGPPAVASSVSTLTRVANPSRRVDFSERLRLREVKWDGTYRDSVANNFSIADDSNSAASGDSNPQSTLTDSRAIKETEIRFLNDFVLGERERRHDRAPRLTRVDVDLPGAGSTALTGVLSRPRDPPAEKSPEKRVSDGSNKYGLPVSLQQQHAQYDKNMNINGIVEGPLGARGNGEDEKRGAARDGMSKNSGTDTRKQKIKKSLKDLPQDDGKCIFNRFVSFFPRTSCFFMTPALFLSLPPFVYRSISPQLFLIIS